MHGEGSVKKITMKVKGAAYEYWSVRYTDNSGKRQRKLFPPTQQGEREARKFHKEMTAKRTKGELISSTKTVADWVSDFIETYKTENLRERSLIRLIQTYAVIEASPLASVPIDRLNASAVQRFYNGLLANGWTDKQGKQHKPLSGSSVRKIHLLLSESFKQAKQDNLIARNPLETVKSPKASYKKMEIFTKDEITNIFSALDAIANDKFNRAQRHDYTLVFMLLLETGVRIGELLALTWQDINFQRREIFVHSSKARDGQIFTDTKTAAGVRRIPIISDVLLTRLKEYRDRDHTIRVQGFVFENQNGGAISYNRVFLMWRHVCKLTGITKTIHAFRHTAATLLLQKGVPTAEVSRILGHSNAATTYRTYVHFCPDYNEIIIRQLQGKSLIADTENQMASNAK